MPKPTMTQPPTPVILNISLSLDDLNMVLEGLGELPAKRSHRILNALQMQALQQLNGQRGEKVATPTDKENLSKAELKRQRKALRLAGGTQGPQPGPRPT